MDSSVVPPVEALARDRLLLQRWRDGDRAAGSELLAIYRPLFLRICARYACREPELHEVFQDVCVKVLEHLPGLPERIQTSFAGYLAWHTRDAIQHLRKREARAPVAASDLPDPVVHDAEPGTWEAILSCARELPPREHEVFELRYLLGLSLQETAERLGSNSNAVGQSVFRLVRKMRACLRARGYDLEAG